MFQGQVPPFAMPQITQFSIQEGLIKAVEGAVDAYGLKALPGSDGEVTVHEDVKEMVVGYKMGTAIPFTASFKACFANDKTSVDTDIQTKTEETVDG